MVYELTKVETALSQGEFAEWLKMYACKKQRFNFGSAKLKIGNLCITIYIIILLFVSS